VARLAFESTATATAVAKEMGERRGVEGVLLVTWRRGGREDGRLSLPDAKVWIGSLSDTDPESESEFNLKPNSKFKSESTETGREALEGDEEEEELFITPEPDEVRSERTGRRFTFPPTSRRISDGSKRPLAALFDAANFVIASGGIELGFAAFTFRLRSRIPTAWMSASKFFESFSLNFFISTFPLCLFALLFAPSSFACSLLLLMLSLSSSSLSLSLLSSILVVPSPFRLALYFSYPFLLLLLFLLPKTVVWSFSFPSSSPSLLPSSFFSNNCFFFAFSFLLSFFCSNVWIFDSFGAPVFFNLLLLNPRRLDCEEEREEAREEEREEEEEKVESRRLKKDTADGGGIRMEELSGEGDGERAREGERD